MKDLKWELRQRNRRRNTELSKAQEIFTRGGDTSGSWRRSTASWIHGYRVRFTVVFARRTRGLFICSVIHCFRSACFFRSVGVFRSSRFPPTFPTQHSFSLLVYHFLIIILAVAVFGEDQFVIIFSWLRFHDFAVSCSTGSCRRRVTLFYSSVGGLGAYSRWGCCEAYIVVVYIRSRSSARITILVQGGFALRGDYWSETISSCVRSSESDVEHPLQERRY